MKRSTKQLLSAVLVIAMMLSMLVVMPAAAAATEYKLVAKEMTNAADVDNNGAAPQGVPSYFTLDSGVTLNNTKATKDGDLYFKLDKTGAVGVTFTVEGTASVAVKFASTSNSKTANALLKNASGVVQEPKNLVNDGETNGGTTTKNADNSVSAYGGTGRASNMTYELTAGTYTFCAITKSDVADDNDTVRLVSLIVTETPSGETPAVKNDYTITVDTVANGTVTTDPAGQATDGNQVTVTATPDPDYMVGTITVTTKSGAAVEVKSGKFVMPGEDVTVSATFVAKPVAGDNEWIADADDADFLAAIGTNGQITGQDEFLVPNTGVTGVKFYLGGAGAQDTAEAGATAKNSAYKYTAAEGDAIPVGLGGGDNPSVVKVKQANASGTLKEVAPTADKPVPVCGAYHKWVAEADGVLTVKDILNANKDVFVTVNGELNAEYSAKPAAKVAREMVFQVSKDDVVVVCLAGSKPMLASFKFEEIETVGGEWTATLDGINGVDGVNGDGDPIKTVSAKTEVQTDVTGVKFFIGGGDGADATNDYKIAKNEAAGLPDGLTGSVNCRQAPGSNINADKPVPTYGTFFEWQVEEDGVLELAVINNGNKQSILTQNGVAVDPYNGTDTNPTGKTLHEISLKVKKNDVVTFGIGGGSKPQLCSFKFTGGGLEEKDVTWTESGVSLGATPTITAVDDNKGTITVTVNGPLVGKKVDMANSTMWIGADKVIVEMYNKAGELVTFATGATAGTTQTVKIEPAASAADGYTFKAKVQKEGLEDIPLTPTASVASFVLPLAQPTILFATPKGLGSDGKGTVEVVWQAVAEATGYNVYRGDTLVTATPVTGLRYTDTGLDVGAEVSYTVEAVRNAEKSAKSAAMKTTVTAEAQTAWGFAYYGESVAPEKNTYSGSVATNDLKVIAKTNGGKVVEGAYDGVSFYYTQIPSTDNFKLTANIHVDTWSFTGGQEGFGLMATDTLGVYDGAYGKTYHNNYMFGGLRTEKSTPKYNGDLGLGMIGETGYTEEQLAEDYANGVTSSPKKVVNVSMDPWAESAGITSLGNKYNLIGNYAADGAPSGKSVVDICDLGGQFSDINLQTNFKFTLERNNTGYFFTYESLDPDNGTNSQQMTKTYKTYKTFDDLCVQDPDNIYVGFFTARNVTISVTDVDLKTIPRAEDDTPVEEPPTIWVDPTLTMNSSTTANSEDYTLILTSNVVGTAHVSVNGTVVGDYDLKPQGDATSTTEVQNGAKRVDIPLTIKPGSNKIYVTLTPAPDSEQGFENEWTKVSALSAKAIDKTVTYETKFDKMVNLYVSPNGSKRGNGSKEHPLDIYTAVTVAQPGQKVILMEGTYNMGRTGTLTVPDNVNGTAEAPIYLMGDPEAETRPILDFQDFNVTGISFAGSYWYCKGFDVTRAGDNKSGINVGGSNNVFDSVDTYYNGGTGIQISRINGCNVKLEDWPSNNVFVNCVSYLNSDTGHGNADGFGSKLTCGTGNEFYGCVAAYNSDDGWDCFAKVETGPIGTVKLYNCYAFMNGFVADHDADGKLIGVKIGEGNGNGFKMGGGSFKAAHEIHDSYAFGNFAKGVDSNSCPDNQVYNTVSFNNRGPNVSLQNTNKDSAYKLENIISVKDDNAVSGVSPKDDNAYGADGRGGKAIGDVIESHGTQATGDVSGANIYLWDGTASKNSTGATLKAAAEVFESVDMAEGIAFIDVPTLTVTRVNNAKTGPISMGNFLKVKDASGVTAPGNLDDVTIDYPAPVDPDLDTITPDDPSVIPAYGSGATPGSSSGRDDQRGDTETTVGENTVEKKTNAAGERVITVKDPNGEVLAEVTLPTTTPTTDKVFADVAEDHWAADAIYEMAARGIVKGVDDENFDKDSAVTRGTLATMLYRLSNGKAGFENKYSDVAEDSWYKDAVAWATKAGVVTGFGDGTFGGDQTITREQLALMLYRYAQLLGLDTTKTADLTSFTDASGVSTWAADGMNWAVANGIINGMGDNTLAPTATATRAQTALMLQRFIALVK